LLKVLLLFNIVFRHYRHAFMQEFDRFGYRRARARGPRDGPPAACEGGPAEATRV